MLPNASCSKTSALKRVRSAVRAAGYRSDRYSTVLSRRAGMCVAFVRYDGGPSTKENPAPRGMLAVLGWGSTWSKCAALAVRRIDSVNMPMPFRLYREVA